jgi:hypothetical protein
MVRRHHPAVKEGVDVHGFGRRPTCLASISLMSDW